MAQERPTIVKLLDGLDQIIGPTILLIVFVDVILQILSRIIPGNAISWTVELGEISLGALIWFGISVAVRNNNHVAFDLLARRFPPFPRKIIGLFAINLFIVYLAWLGVLTIELLQHYGKLDSRTTILDLSMFWVRLPILLGCVATIVRLVIKQVNVIRGTEEAFASGEHLD